MQRKGRRGLRATLLVAVLLLVCCLMAVHPARADEQVPDVPVAAEQASAEEGVSSDGATAPDGMAAPDGAMPEGMPEGGAPPSMADREATTWEADTAEVPDTAGDIYNMVMVGVVVLGVAALALLAVAVVKLVRKPASKGAAKKSGPVVVVMGVVAVACVAAAVVVNVLAFDTYRNSINALFTQTERAETNITTDAADWQGLASRIGEEGMTLLKNDGDVLPLEKGAKVNLLGYRAYDPVYSGSGSGATSSEGAIDFAAALTNAGFEVNSAPVDEGVYSVEEGEGKGLGFMGASFSVDEVGLDRYTGEASFESMQSYSDVAIVVIGRTGGEGSDLTQFEGEAGKTYLQLSSEEEALLRQARETFGTVVVLYNGVNTMELGYLDQYADAALWVGIPGSYGLSTLGQILNGEVNPSGSTVDTWAYDLDSAAASENYGEQLATNYDDQYYVDYVENIYVGYKWYETAYAEGAVITNTNTGDTYDFANDYEGIVQYPFGYGLSYTTFEQSIDSVSAESLDPHGELTVEVTVTNAGDVAGKEPVQLYLTSPYTDYDRANGVEKSAVQLLTFGKTKLLAPGESQTVELTVDVEEMAAYDMSHDNGDGTTGSYMLDAGEYVLSVRSDAHTELDSATVSMDEQYFYSGENKRDSDETVAYNKTEAARGTYLSRADGFANYAEAMEGVSTEVEDNSFLESPNTYDASFDDAVTEELVEGVDYGAEGNLTLADMKGLSYDDAKWGELISQLTFDELKKLPSDSMFGIGEIESISKARTSESDGPLGVSSMFSTATNTAYPSIPVLAATFNTELACTYGSYIADEAHSIGNSGWYAPAMNIHRWAFSGRNFEYYSEDGTLSAKMGASETKGARDKGLTVYLKHFVLNDQETRRSGNLHTYSNEQAIREIYMRPFEACVKDGNATAIMNAMNFVGDKWIGVCGEIQNDVVRSEWGFRGRILTDVDEGGYMADSAAAAIRNGTDMWLTMGGELKLVPGDEATGADIRYLQGVAHNVLYAEANAQVSAATVLDWQTPVRVIQASLGVIAVACVLIAVGAYKKKTAA